VSLAISIIVCRFRSCLTLTNAGQYLFGKPALKGARIATGGLTTHQIGLANIPTMLLRWRHDVGCWVVNS
jgi:hypothetical protein